MVATSPVVLRVTLLLCSVVSISWSQGAPRRRRPATLAPPISPAADGATELTVRFLPDDQPSFLEANNFGQRLTSRPRQPAVLSLQPGPRPVLAAPVRRLEVSTRPRVRTRPTLDVSRRQSGNPAGQSPDWTPIWPGDRVSSGAGGNGVSGEAAGDLSSSESVRGDAPSSTESSPVERRQEPVAAIVDRAPVTEYYFSSTVPAAGVDGESVFPSVRLPTATFASAAPTRHLPLPSASPRPVFLISRPPVAGSTSSLRRGVTRLADRLSALVTSRVAQTTIISPTPAAPTDSPTSRVVLPPQPNPPSDAIQTVDAPDGSELGLEPSTRAPLGADIDVVTYPPTSAPPTPAAEPVTVTPEEVDPTPASAPCNVTTQGPGGYCRNGDLLTVLTRAPDDGWEEYRVVRLPSATVAALDGEEEGSATTEDPIGVTESSVPETAGQSTPGAEEQPTSSPEIADITEATTHASSWSSGIELPSSPAPTESTVSPLTEPPVVATVEDERTTADEVETTTPRSPITQRRTRPTLIPGGRRSRPTFSWPGTRVPPTSSSVPDSEGSSTTVADSSSNEDVEALDEELAVEKDAAELVYSAIPAVSSDEASGLTNSAPVAGSEPPSPTPSPEPPTVVGPEEDEAPQNTTHDTPLADGSLKTTEPGVTSSPASSEEGKDQPSQADVATQPNGSDVEPLSPSPTSHMPPSSSPTAFTSPSESTFPTSPSPIETFPTNPATTETPSTQSSLTLETTIAEDVMDEAPTATTLPSGAAASTPRGTWSTPGWGEPPKGKVSVPSSVTGPPPRRGNFTGTTGQFDSTHPTTHQSTKGFTTTSDYGYTTDNYDYNTYDYSTAPSYTTTGVSGYTTPVAGYPNYGYTGTSGSSDYSTDATGFSNHSTHSTTEPTTTKQTTSTNPPTLTTSSAPPTTTDTNQPGTIFTTPDTTVTTDSTDYTSTIGPTTSRKPGITHSSVVPPVEVYVQFLMDTSWDRFCQMNLKFRQTVVNLLNKEAKRNLTADNAVLFNIPLCGGSSVRARRSSAILVFLYIVDNSGKFDRTLTERVEPLWEAAEDSPPEAMVGLVREVDTIRPNHHLLAGDDDGSAGVIVAVSVSCVAVASLVLLAVLLFVVRHRRRAAQAAQRCNPVSLEDYGVESVFSSMRRKNKLRRSVRSYLNHAFDDHDAPSNSVNFAGLANLSSDLAALKEEFDSIPTSTMPTLDDLPPGSEDKNRYANVLPVPETRVVLDQKTAAPNSDYINANYVRGAKEEPQFYIATQGPLESTVNDFWRMTWETQSKVVLCLTDVVERGVRRCAEYLPPSEALDRHRLYGDFQVTLMSKVKKDKYVVSIVQLKNMDSNLFREVAHLWYSGWPERGVPSDLDSLVQYSLEARKVMKTNIGPTIVHCSPGTGRTGVMIAVDMCIRQFEASRSADIMRTVFRIRQDRAGAVQTREQYALIYKVLNQYAASVTSGNLPTLE